MARYASDAKAYGISDRSGFRFRLRDMRKEWNGFLVGEDEYEPKHPQLSPAKVQADPQALKNPRPEQNLVQQRNIQWGWYPVGGGTDNGINPPNNLVAIGSVGEVEVQT